MSIACRISLTVWLIASAALARAQSYPYFPPPGWTYTAGTGILNAQGTNNAPNGAAPVWTLGNQSGLITGSPTINLFTGGTGNGTQINSDDGLTYNIGSGGVPSIPPTGFSCPSGDLCLVASPNMAWDFGGNNDPFQAGEVNTDTSYTISATGTTATATSTIATNTDRYGVTGMRAQISCTNTSGHLDTGAGGLGLMPNITNAPHIAGCVLTTAQNGPPPLALATNLTYRGMLNDLSGNWVLDDGTAHATTDTNKFVYLPKVAGVPTGVPANLATFYANSVPVRFDTTDNRSYFYNSGWINTADQPTTLTAPTASGCTITSFVAVATAGGALKHAAGSFASGTTGTCTVTITLPSTTHTWVCHANDLSTPANLIDQTTPTSATACTITGTTTSGDSMNFSAEGF